MAKRLIIKKNKKRKAILDAAELIIAQKGFRAMTMDDVAKRADVAKGTLYLYFNNKDSLSAAVSARINKELNKLIEEKINHHKTGTEKIVSSGTAVVEFSIKNKEKWKVATELYQIKFKDPQDPNVIELLNEVNKMIHMMSDAYKQGKEEGTIRKDLEPVSTAIFARMAFTNAFTPTSEQKMLLNLNNIDKEQYLSTAWGLINRSTHITPSIRVDEKANDEFFDKSGKEMKKIAESMGLKARNAKEIFNAWETVTQIIMGKAEYKIKKSDDDCFIVHITSCPILNSEEVSETINSPENCSKYCASVIENLNPKYTQRFTEKICNGEPYCESIIELKK